MCDFCSLKPGEEQFGYTFSPTILWTKVKRLENNMLQLVFGYGEDLNDQAWLRAFYCPMCGEKQEIRCHGFDTLPWFESKYIFEDDLNE